MNHKIKILFSQVVVVVVDLFLCLFLLINIVIVWNIIYENIVMKELLNN